MSRFLARWTRLCLEVVPVVAVGCAVFFLIRTHLLEYYRVPTGSMEPTLHGDARHGDLVLVNKTAWWFHQPAPWDVVVVRAAMPGDNHLVKRVAVLGPASVSIDDGDVFVGPMHGHPPFERLVKHPVQHADMRITLFQHPDPHCERTLEDVFHVPPDGHELRGDEIVLAPATRDAETLLALLDRTAREPTKDDPAPTIPALITTNKPVDTSFLNPAGRLVSGKSRFPDIGLGMDLSAVNASAMLFVFEFQHHDYALLWRRDGRLQLVVDGCPTGAVVKRVMTRSLHRLAFGYLDGHLFLVVGEDVLYHQRLALKRDADRVRHNGLFFGIAGGGAHSARITRIRLFRDVSITPQDGAHGRGSAPYQVESGQMFLLGDNTENSTDSRMTPPVDIGRLVGRPTAILGPAGRARFFVR